MNGLLFWSFLFSVWAWRFGPDRAQSTTSSWEKNRWNNGGPPVVPGDVANISRFIEGRGKKEDYISEGCA
jgi:hypothetical protein